jgi:HK97 family phage prohead protease
MNGATMTDDQMLYRGFTPDLEIRSASKGGDGRTVEGITVPFNRSQRIHEGLTERFARGAFNHQIGAFHRVKFTRGHEMMGGALIGRGVEARDDASGLWGAFRVSATPAGDETLELIRDGALDELSIGFRERPGRNRTLPDGTIERTKADMFETAVVSAGAYGQGARIKALRAAGIYVPAQLAGELDDALEDDLDDAAAEVVAHARATTEPTTLERVRLLLATVPNIPDGRDYL